MADSRMPASLAEGLVVLQGGFLGEDYQFESSAALGLLLFKNCELEPLEAWDVSGPTATLLSCLGPCKIARYCRLVFMPSNLAFRF